MSTVGCGNNLQTKYTKSHITNFSLLAIKIYRTFKKIINFPLSNNKKVCKEGVARSHTSLLMGGSFLVETNGHTVRTFILEKEKKYMLTEMLARQYGV